MKNANYRTTAVLAVILAIAVNLSSPQTSAASYPISYEWRFDSSANPSTPEVSAGGAGAAQASIVVGEFGTGWMANNAVLGSAQGIWDLGRNGTITLNNPSGLAGASGQDRVLTIKVTQYQDGGIYGVLARVSIADAQFVSTRNYVVASADIGNWVIEESQWRAPAGAALNSILITSANDGSLVDRIAVETSLAAVQPPQLAIRRVGPANSQVEISWPASYSNMVLQSTATINDPQAWTTVQATVQVSGNVRSVTLDAAGSARFYRLKQP